MKTNMKKKILCIITALTVMFTMSSVSVLALDQPGDNPVDRQPMAQGESQPSDGQLVEAQNTAREIPGLTATAGDKTVTLRWNAVTPESGYALPTSDIYTVTCSDTSVIPQDGFKTDNTDQTITGVNFTNLKKYSFTVTATTTKSGEPDIEYSSTVTAIPSGKLDVPKTVSGYNRVTVKWTATEGLTGADYVLYRDGVTVDVSGASIVDGNFVFTDRVTGQSDKVAYNYIYNPTYKYSVQIKDNPDSVSEAANAQPIKRAYITVTTKMKKSLKSHNSRARLYLPKGSRIHTVDYGGGKYRFYDKSGNLFYITRISTKKASATYKKTVGGGWYGAEEAQNFVNQKGIGSSTNKLIWVSSYTQHAYIFQGYAGNWTLIKHWKISTGKASSPSPTGTKQISKKIKNRHGIKYWSCYSSLNALHGVKRNWGSKLGSMQSSGCIRNPNSSTAGAQWIYYNCGKKTRVLVY